MGTDADWRSLKVLSGKPEKSESWTPPNLGRDSQKKRGRDTLKGQWGGGEGGTLLAKQLKVNTGKRGVMGLTSTHGRKGRVSPSRGGRSRD